MHENKNEKWYEKQGAPAGTVAHPLDGHRFDGHRKEDPSRVPPRRGRSTDNTPSLPGGSEVSRRERKGAPSRFTAPSILPPGMACSAAIVPFLFLSACTSTLFEGSASEKDPPPPLELSPFKIPKGSDSESSGSSGDETSGVSGDGEGTSADGWAEGILADLPSDDEESSTSESEESSSSESGDEDCVIGTLGCRCEDNGACGPSLKCDWSGKETFGVCLHPMGCSIAGTRCSELGSGPCCNGGCGNGNQQCSNEHGVQECC